MATRTAQQDGTWHSSSTWNAAAPGAGDSVVVNGKSVRVGTGLSAAATNVDGGTSGSVLLHPGASLVISGTGTGTITAAGIAGSTVQY